MEPTSRSGTFETSGTAYDSFMGRYSRPLAASFADIAGIVRGQSVLDVGCGPGALTGVLVDRLGADAVSALDPSASFVAACTERYPGVDVRAGRAEAMPFDDACFDAALSQLVLHFVPEPAAVGSELRRVVRAGGTVSACVWDFAQGMEVLRLFWDSALEVEPSAPDEARTMRFGRPGELADWLDGAGFEDVDETTLEVTSDYADFDELWSGFLEGIGPAGSFCLSLADGHRAAVRAAMFRRLGSPAGAIRMGAVARAACARVPL